MLSLCEEMYKKWEFYLIGILFKRRSQAIVPVRSSVERSETGSGRDGAAKQNQDEQADKKKRGDGVFSFCYH